MDVVTKSVDATINPVESENPNGEFEVVLSTEALDRDGERLYTDEWKQPLPKRIQIDGDHSRSIEKTVGSVVPRIEGNKLIGKGSYAPTEYGQTIRAIASDKAAEGHGLSLSVTYGESKNQKDGKPVRELFNAGFVAIPANPECVVLSSKSVDTDLVPRVKSALEAVLKDFGASGDNPVTHDGMVQAIHDASYQLGAECMNMAEADPGVDEGGNKSVGTVYVDVVPRLKSPETSSDKAGKPQESTDESAAADQKSAAADESADPTAEKERLALRARSLTFLMHKSSKE